jgi:hypothetical protein
VSDEKDKPTETPAAAASPERVTVPEGVESVLPEDAPRIQLPLFEGPLDLLLYLIKREKIDIHDIPIAPITRQYMEYLDLMRELSLDVAGEFMVMAATLIHIKRARRSPSTPARSWCAGSSSSSATRRRPGSCTSRPRSAPRSGRGRTR